MTGGNIEQFRRDLPFTLSQLTERFISSDTLTPLVRDSDLEIQTLLSSPIQEVDEDEENSSNEDEDEDEDN